MCSKRTLSFLPPACFLYANFMLHSGPHSARTTVDSQWMCEAVRSLSRKMSLCSWVVEGVLISLLMFGLSAAMSVEFYPHKHTQTHTALQGQLWVIRVNYWPGIRVSESRQWLQTDTSRHPCAPRGWTGFVHLCKWVNHLYTAPGLMSISETVSRLHLPSFVANTIFKLWGVATSIKLIHRNIQRSQEQKSCLSWLESKNRRVWQADEEKPQRSWWLSERRWIMAQLNPRR